MKTLRKIYGFIVICVMTLTLGIMTLLWISMILCSAFHSGEIMNSQEMWVLLLHFPLLVFSWKAWLSRPCIDYIKQLINYED